MFRVALIDDEPWALIGIRKSFSWNKMGFEVIGESTDPINALRLIEREKPDVVFTDIRMPEMSGIELMKTIRSQKINSEVVIVSGFAEFSWAQEAMRQGAFDYLLKPIDIECSDHLLSKLYNRLQEKKYASDLNLYEELIKYDNKDLKELLDYKKDKGYFQLFQCVRIMLEEYDPLEDVFVSTAQRNIAKLMLGPRQYLFILNSACENADYIRSECGRIRSRTDFSAGISELSETAETINSLIRQADIAAHNQFIHGKRATNVYIKGRNEEVDRILHPISTNIVNKKYSGLEHQFSELPEIFERKGLTLSDAVYFWNRMVDLYYTLAGSRPSPFSPEFMDYFEIVNRFSGFDSLCKHLYDIFLPFADDQRELVYDKNPNNNFIQLLNYVDHNFNKDLHLKDLSNQFYINFTYCCDLFKKIERVTFSEYITNLRMKKAVILLQDENISITQIYNMIGYNDYYYFNKVFKKYYGTTPAKYRNEVMKQPELRNCL